MTTERSPKEYARWLHETACLPYDEACRMAGWSPFDEYREAARIFLGVAIVFAVLASALYLIPFADAAEQKQQAEAALASCLNQRGMMIGGELWICTPTGLKP